ncbi:hypothetical protein R1flu_007202 [Riccia fluitans]|uniref:Uncharacterized protein n=1 Tax=Riccia fluitans TaxID=41844 RepID=A0ABD1YYZ2_9MARC
MGWVGEGAWRWAMWAPCFRGTGTMFLGQNWVGRGKLVLTLHCRGHGSRILGHNRAGRGQDGMCAVSFGLGMGARSLGHEPHVVGV